MDSKRSLVTQCLVVLGLLWARPFALAAGEAAAVAPALEWMSFEDPFESAFSAEVPRGWSVKGGLFRVGVSDARPMLDLTSPDGRINIRLGDVSVPPYSIPTAVHAREGELYDLGADAQMIVARYREGPQFAVLYSHARFFPFCRHPTGDSANMDFVMPDYVPPDGSAVRSSTGQIAYRCDSAQGARIAFAFARTSSYGPIWLANSLASFMSPPEQALLARRVLLRAAHSFQFHTRWTESQRPHTRPGNASASGSALAVQAQVSAMRQQLDAFRRRQSAPPTPVETLADALCGVRPTLYPLTGAARDPWPDLTGNYWTNGIGEVINSRTAPSPAWHPLEVAYPD